MADVQANPRPPAPQEAIAESPVPANTNSTSGKCHFRAKAPTNPNGSNLDAGGGYNSNESYKREPLKTSPSDYGNSDTQEPTDTRRSDRQYPPSYQQPGPRPAAPEGPYSSVNTDSQNNSYSTNASAYSQPPSGTQPNQGYQNNNAPSYQSTTATINYQPTTASPGYPSTPNYQPNNATTPQSASLSSSAKPPTTQAQYPPSPATPVQPPSSSYQPPTTQPPFQPSYQQGYQNKQVPQSLPPKREPPSATTTPSRPAAPNLQRQQSSLNTNQRPYQPSLSPVRPPVPQSVATPRTTSYTPPSMQNYQPYQSSPVTRPPSQTLSSYSTSRPSSQRTPTSTDADLLSSNPSYPRSPSYGKDSARWSEADTRPTAAVAYSSGFAEKDSALRETPSTNAARPDLKTSMQDKFKAMTRQNTQLDSSSVPPVRIPEAALPRPLSRKNSEINPQLVKTGSGGFDDIGKAAVSTKPDLLEDGDEDEDNLDFEDKIPSEEGSPTYVTKTIKFFEQNDKARVPLAPKLPQTEKKERPARPTHIDIVSSIGRADGEYESGVDESPMMHPNLRSISDTPKRVARIRSASSGRQWVTPRASYPGTPTRAASTPSRSTPNTPKRNKPSLRFKPEEELINFFHGSDYEHSAGKENRPRTNGVPVSPKKTPSKLPSSTRKTPTSTPLKSPSTAMSIPKTPDSPSPAVPLIKKVPMNKIQVGAAPSPNIKQVKSKIGSLANTTHKPGGGNIKIESHKLNITAQSRIAAKNDAYVPTGGDKKIQHVKLQWNAKSKVGSLENASYKPGGGDKKIESAKLDFKDKAKSKVGSKDNVQYVPGGGDVKSRNSAGRKSVDIQSQKLEFKAESKVGSLNNVKHRPGGGDVKIFDDKTYMKQVASTHGSGHQVGSKSSCDLTVVSEVRGATINSNDDVTDISIKKTTTILAAEPNMSKTTEVTVVTRSPSKERRAAAAAAKSLPPATHHEVKLTYSTVSSPALPKATPQPVEVVRVPAVEHAPILNPRAVDADADYKPPLPSTLSSASDRNGMASKDQDKEAMSTESGVKNPTKEPSQPKTDKLKKEDHSDAPGRREEVPKPDLKPPAIKEQNLTKLLQNEAATHEKVGEIWKESQKADFPVNESVSRGVPPSTKQSESPLRPVLNQANPQAQTYRSPQQSIPTQQPMGQHQLNSPQQQRFNVPQQQPYNQPPRPQYIPNPQRSPYAPTQPPGSMQRPPNADNRTASGDSGVRLATARIDSSSYQQTHDSASRLK